MRTKEIALILTCLSATALADELPKCHFIGPKVFYRNHQEKSADGWEYHHKVMGVGVEYHFEQQKGINFHAEILRSFKEKSPYVDVTWQLKYLGIFQCLVGFYPHIAGKSFSHRIGSADENKWSFTRSSFHAGIGHKWHISHHHSLDTHVGLARDIHAFHLIETAEGFYGIHRDTFLGVRGHGKWEYKINPFSCVGLEGEYTKMFRKGYEEMKGALSVRFGF